MFVFYGSYIAWNHYKALLINYDFFFVGGGRKQLKDFFNSSVLNETVVQILDTFMSTGSPHQWLGYLIPEDPGMYKFVASTGSGSEDHSYASKFKQLTAETRAVLSRFTILFINNH